MSAAAERMQILASDLTNVRTFEDKKLEILYEEMDVRLCLIQAISDNALSARSNEVELRLEADDDLPRVQADRHWLRQALDKLLAAAIDSVTPNGEVTAGARSVDDGVLLSVSMRCAQGKVCALPGIFNSLGMNAGELAAEDNAANVGLAIAKRIIASHGCTTDVASDGDGAQISFLLPLEPPRGSKGTGPAN